jgi:hypothetical protein
MSIKTLVKRHAPERLKRLLRDLRSLAQLLPNAWYSAARRRRA